MSRLRRAAKYSATGVTSAALACIGYVYVTTPAPVSSTAYRNTSPLVVRGSHLDKLRNDLFDIIVVGGGATATRRHL